MSCESSAATLVDSVNFKFSHSGFETNCGGFTDAVCAKRRARLAARSAIQTGESVPPRTRERDEYLSVRVRRREERKRRMIKGPETLCCERETDEKESETDKEG